MIVRQPQFLTGYCIYNSLHQDPHDMAAGFLQKKLSETENTTEKEAAVFENLLSEVTHCHFWLLHLLEASPEIQPFSFIS